MNKKNWKKNFFFFQKISKPSQETFWAFFNRVTHFTDHQQRVVLNGQTSSWQNVYVGVPQGSVLGPLLFLVYINDFPGRLTSACKIFADDTSLEVFFKSNSNSQLNSDLAKISK